MRMTDILLELKGKTFLIMSLPVTKVVLIGFENKFDWFFLRSLQESGQFINQFPNENSLVCKDLLAAVCQSATLRENGKEDDLLRRGPEWLPVTFNLNFELPLFLHHYLKRKSRYA